MHPASRDELHLLSLNTLRGKSGTGHSQCSVLNSGIGDIKITKHILRKLRLTGLCLDRSVRKKDSYSRSAHEKSMQVMSLLQVATFAIL